MLVSVIALSGCASSGSLKKLSDDELYNFKWSTSAIKSAHRQELVRRHPDWRQDVQSDVLAGQIKVGMTKQQVLSSIGIPAEIMGRSPSQEDDHAVWVYRGKHLEFNENLLVAIYTRKVISSHNE